MPHAIHLESHETRASKNQGDGDAASWSFQPAPDAVRELWITDGPTVRVMTASETAAVLGVIRANRIRSLAAEARGYGELFLSAVEQQEVQIAYLAAQAEGRTSALAYLQPSIAFDQAMKARYRTLRDEMLTAPDYEALGEVSMDFSPVPIPERPSIATAAELT